MADSLISATIQVALETALSLATDRIGILFGFKGDLASMNRSLGLVRAVLSDAEQRQAQDRAVQEWLNNLEGVAFDADNVLDELNYEFLRHKVDSRNRLKQKVCCFFSSSISIAFHWRMASKVRDINEKLIKINQEAADFGLINRYQNMLTLPVIATTGVMTSRKTDSLIGQNFVGRDNDELEIVDALLSFSEKVVSVFPIVGMGGLGKTTLAKLVYNNQRIDGYFKRKIWICVSEKFEEVELFKLILESLTKRRVELDSRDAIVQEIRKELDGQRYLLVLDDVWNAIPERWEDFFYSLVGLSTTYGSCCLVTTRSLNVASVVTRNPPYLLKKLSDEDCWSILKEKAISYGEVPKELSGIREEITKRCCGLPLAAGVIGGLLGLKRKEEWPSILENRLFKLSGDKNSVMQILKLSFDCLPSPSIKKCFAYCSIFLKDTEINGDQLIELWMAEGFLQPDLQNERMMEEIGEKYAKVLLQSSLLEEVKGWGGKTCYKMHDLVHDLAESISKSQSINLETSEIDNNYQARYLAVNSYGEKAVKLLETTSTALRTLFLESGCISSEMLSKFKNLHVLNLSGEETRELSITIPRLKHLRYIDFSYSKIHTLPESLCKLYNLQTLRIIRCNDLKFLPKGMSNLISLRHLHYYTRNTSFQMPIKMGRLTSLQTLEFFNIGQEKGRRIEELGCLKDLKGTLEIRNLELVKGKEEAEKANLIGKERLFGLVFQWSSTNRGRDNSCDGDLLEGLRPHSNLQELVIENFMGDQFPQWYMDLSRLVALELRDCNRSRELPVALGLLPSLQNLQLNGLESISCIGLSFYGIDSHNTNSSHNCAAPRTFFPALKTLSLYRMQNLVEWMDAKEVSSTTTGGGEVEVVHVFPVLGKLTILDCSQLTTTPSHLSSLKELEIGNNNHASVVRNIFLSKVTCSSLSTLSITCMAGLTCASDIVAAAASAGLPNNNTIFQNLQDLTLEICPNLTSIRGWVGTCLESLNLHKCENLRELPADLCEFRSLRILGIYNCPKIVIMPKSLSNLMSLEELVIIGCDELTNLPGEMSNALQLLCVHNCPNLVSFPLDLQQTPSFSKLELYGCLKLKTNMTPKGFGFLASLWHVSIGPFSDDENSSSSVYSEFDWSGLKSSSTLRQLWLYGLPHMESLPPQLQHLTTLTNLRLCSFGGIEALPDWIGNLESLQILSLRHCEKLRCLPSMDAMRRLTKLTYLHIQGCPLLKERCTTPQTSNPSESSEWSKIAYISNRVFH